MIQGLIRAKVVCLFAQGDRWLLTEGLDPLTQQTYWMPIGGGIEFGETSQQAIEREIFEEIGAQAQDFQCLGVLENHFCFAGQAGHEIVFVYRARFVDPIWYQQTQMTGVESNGMQFRVDWISRSQFDQQPIYPDGIQQWMTLV